MKEGMTTEVLGTIMTLISAVWSIVDKTDASMAQKIETFKAKMKK